MPNFARRAHVELRDESQNIDIARRGKSDKRWKDGHQTYGSVQSDVGGGNSNNDNGHCKANCTKPSVAPPGPTRTLTPSAHPPPPTPSRLLAGTTPSTGVLPTLSGVPTLSPPVVGPFPETSTPTSSGTPTDNASQASQNTSVPTSNSNSSPTTTPLLGPSSRGGTPSFVSTSTNQSGVPSGTDSMGTSHTLPSVTTSGSTTPLAAANTGGTGSTTGAIVGGVLGTLAFTFLALVALMLIRRRRRRRRTAASSEFISARRPWVGSPAFQRTDLAAAADPLSTTESRFRERSETPRSFLHVNEKSSG